MTVDNRIVEWLADCRRRWEGTEDHAALAEAVALCGLNGFPLPEWTLYPILEGLELRNEATARVGGRTSSPAKRTAMLGEYGRRWLLVRAHRALNPGANGKRPSIDKCCAEVAKRPDIYCAADAIKTSYNKVRRAIDAGHGDIYGVTGDEFSC